MARVGISLGSNLGDRLGNLREAIEQLGSIRCSSHFLASGVYETDPVDCPRDSPSFLNAVIEVETESTPEEVHGATLSVEATMGRPNERERNAPRVIDIDILYYDEVRIEYDDLTIPHPRMQDRAFVLLPLAEIREEWCEAAAGISQEGIRRLEESL